MPRTNFLTHEQAKRIAEAKYGNCIDRVSLQETLLILDDTGHYEEKEIVITATFI